MTMRGYRSLIRDSPVVEIWRINARLHFWQLVQQGVANKEDWPRLSFVSRCGRRLRHDIVDIRTPV